MEQSTIPSNEGKTPTTMAATPSVGPAYEQPSYATQSVGAMISALLGSGIFDVINALGSNTAPAVNTLSRTQKKRRNLAIRLRNLLDRSISADEKLANAVHHFSNLPQCYKEVYETSCAKNSKMHGQKAREEVARCLDIIQTLFTSFGTVNTRKDKMAVALPIINAFESLFKAKEHNANAINAEILALQVGQKLITDFQEEVAAARGAKAGKRVGLSELCRAKKCASLECLMLSKWDKIRRAMVDKSREIFNEMDDFHKANQGAVFPEVLENPFYRDLD